MSSKMPRILDWYEALDKLQHAIDNTQDVIELTEKGLALLDWTSFQLFGDYAAWQQVTGEEWEDALQQYNESPEEYEPEPEPEPTLQSTDFVTLLRAEMEKSTGADGSLAQLIQEHVWQAVRDPEYVRIYCPEAFGTVFQTTLSELDEYLQSANLTHKTAKQLLDRIDKENRRFPGRSEVHKVILAGVKAKMRADLVLAHIWRNKVVGRCDVKPYDSIRGWCQCERERR